MRELDARGRPVRTRQYINTHVNTEVLIGDGWEAIAQTEFIKIRMMVDAYRSQLEDQPFADDLAVASAALRDALAKLEETVKRNEAAGGLGL